MEPCTKLFVGADYINRPENDYPYEEDGYENGYRPYQQVGYDEDFPDPQSSGPDLYMPGNRTARDGYDER